MKDNLFVTCARGLEDILAEELKQILHSHPIVDKGGVHVHGKLKELYQINLLTRIGMHVLKPILELKSNNINQIVSGGNFLINKEEFECSYKNILKGSRNPLNRKKIKLEICKRNLTN